MLASRKRRAGTVTDAAILKHAHKEVTEFMQLDWNNVPKEQLVEAADPGEWWRRSGESQFPALALVTKRLFAICQAAPRQSGLRPLLATRAMSRGAHSTRQRPPSSCFWRMRRNFCEEPPHFFSNFRGSKQKKKNRKVIRNLSLGVFGVPKPQIRGGGTQTWTQINLGMLNPGQHCHNRPYLRRRHGV